LFERGTIEIPNDPDLLNQLAALKYDTDKRGRTLIMDKRALKKEIGSSPNEADALAMLFYELDTMISKKVNYDYVYRNKDTSNTTWMCG
jgi:hypothetical protein